MSSRLNAVREACRLDPEARTEENVADILDFVKDVKFFTKLDIVQQRALCRTMTLETFGARENICTIDEVGDKFYIILTGGVSVQVPSTTAACPNGVHGNGQKCDCPNRVMENIVLLEKGMGFGELALQSDQKRSATIVTCEPTECLVTQRSSYEMYAGALHRQFIEQRVHFLREFPRVEDALRRCLVSTQDIAAMANCLNERSLGGNEVVVRQGDVVEAMIFVRSGQLSMIRTIDLDALPEPSGRGKAVAAPVAADRAQAEAQGDQTSGQLAQNLARAMMNMRRQERETKRNLMEGEAQKQKSKPRASVALAAQLRGSSRRSISPPSPSSGAARSGTGGLLSESKDTASDPKGKVGELDPQPNGGGVAADAVGVRDSPRGASKWSKLKNSVATASLLTRTVTAGFAAKADAAPAIDAQPGVPAKAEKAAINNIEHLVAVSTARRKVGDMAFREMVNRKHKKPSMAQSSTTAEARLSSGDGKRLRLLNIGTVKAYQYFGDEQICNGTTYPVSLVSDPVAELYLMSKTDILRRLPKKLFAVLFTPEGEAVPPDVQLMENLRQTSRWASFRQVTVADALRHRTEGPSVPRPLRSANPISCLTGKKRVDVAANSEFLGIGPAQVQEQIGPGRRKAPSMTPKEEEWFSDSPAGFLRDYQHMKKDRQLHKAFVRQGLRNWKRLGNEGSRFEYAEGRDPNDFNFEQSWSRCGQFPGLDLGDDATHEDKSRPAAGPFAVPPASFGSGSAVGSGGSAGFTEQRGAPSPTVQPSRIPAGGGGGGTFERVFGTEQTPQVTPSPRPGSSATNYMGASGRADSTTLARSALHSPGSAADGSSPRRRTVAFQE